MFSTHPETAKLFVASPIKTTVVPALKIRINTESIITFRKRCPCEQVHSVIVNSLLSYLLF
jgi:hypothetical protein